MRSPSPRRSAASSTFFAIPDKRSTFFPAQAKSEYFFGFTVSIPAISNLFLTKAQFPLENLLSFAELLAVRMRKGEGPIVMASPLQQKLKVNGPVVITANRLSDGAVVHRTKSGLWTEKLSAAQVLRSAAEAQIALKEAQADGLAAVGPYVAPIDANRPGVEPGNLRELIRACGPTFAIPGDLPERVAA
jgi:hypothetical protein